jgi:hypothetical protein
MTSGFYSMAYTGAVGTGFGLIAMSRGVIAGADVAGGMYDGTYVEKASGIDFKMTMRLPAGIIPVQTGVPLTQPMTLPFDALLPSDLGAEKPLLLQLPLGPINVIFRKVRDLPE